MAALLTVPEFVAQTIAAVHDVGSDDRTASLRSWALGTLAGAALQRGVAFPMSFIEEAEAVETMDDVKNIETLIAEYLGAL